MRLKFVGSDRACDFHLFSTDLVRKETLVKILLDREKFLVDIFHVLKHKESCCMPPDNPKYGYRGLSSSSENIQRNYRNEHSIRRTE